MFNFNQDISFYVTNIGENDIVDFDVVPLHQTYSIEIICAVTSLRDASYLRWTKLFDKMVTIIMKARIFSMFFFRYGSACLYSH